MIWYYLILFLGNILNAVFSAFGVPKVSTLPFGMDGYLSTAVGYFNNLFTLAPWLYVAWQALLWYAGFRLLIFLLTMFRILPAGH